jgi:hypothetical protein
MQSSQNTLAPSSVTGERSENTTGNSEPETSEKANTPTRPPCLAPSRGGSGRPAPLGLITYV